MRRIGGPQGMRRFEAIYGPVAAVYGCAVEALLAVAINSGIIPAWQPGALFLVAAGFLAYLAVGLGAALHAGETPEGAASATGAAGVALLWIGTAVAGLQTTLGVLSYGIFLLPGTALAVAASVTALVRVRAQPRPPSPLGWLELLSGVAAPVAGLVGLGALFYWPSIYYSSSDTAGYFSRIEVDGIAPMLPLLLGTMLLGIVVAVGAALHALQRVALGAALLWLATLPLAAATALAFAGIDTVRYLSLAGPYLVPVLTLAVLASLASAGRVTGHGTPSTAIG